MEEFVWRVELGKNQLVGYYEESRSATSSLSGGWKINNESDCENNKGIRVEIRWKRAIASGFGIRGKRIEWYHLI